MRAASISMGDFTVSKSGTPVINGTQQLNTPASWNKVEAARELSAEFGGRNDDFVPPNSEEKDLLWSERHPVSGQSCAEQRTNI